MDIIIRPTNFILTDSIKDFALDKFALVDKVMTLKKTEPRLEVEIEKVPPAQKKGDIYRVEANFIFMGNVIRVEKTGDDVYQKIVEVRDKLKHEISNFKKTMVEKRRNVSVKESEAGE